MRRILFATLVGVLLVGPVKAQEMTGPVAEKAKKEVLMIETEKLGDLKQNGSEAADWFARVDDDGMILASADGVIETKSEHEAKLRSRESAIVTMKQYDHRARVFADGNVVVVTYKQTGQTVGQGGPSDGITEDVWIKKDGKWMRILHSLQRVSKH
jgi:hypothetical protein